MNKSTNSATVFIQDQSFTKTIKLLNKEKKNSSQILINLVDHFNLDEPICFKVLRKNKEFKIGLSEILELSISFSLENLNTETYPISFIAELEHLFMDNRIDEMIIKEQDMKRIISIISVLSDLQSPKENNILFMYYFRIFIKELILFSNSSKSENRIISRDDHIYLSFKRLLTIHHIKERKIQFYADNLFISNQQLSLIVKKKTGHSAKSEILKFLLRRIKQMLIETSMTISEISYFLSFNSPAELNKFVKKYTGLSPQKLRTNFLKHIESI
ncbi:helix-turn-helix domain-containing protein [Aquiflexum lacus]|uniref:helix-turn-helix domain-containing protein n=1 Tax=Aquiflexum lacus TaxID=2483805 RepID=UPI0018937EBB|nr:helix-turn-helix domain-containing protein [Aquiflexum lacus]